MGTRAGRVGSDIIAWVLATSLGEDRNPNLTKLDLHDNKFTNNASHEALFRALGAAMSLSYLDLGNCDLEDDGIKKVCHALFASNTTLELLDLSGNGVTRHGANHIAEYVRENGGNLKILRLEDNLDLTSKGVVAIASAFRGSEDVHNIEEIQLNSCMIGAIGARALIDAFGPNGNDMPNLNHIYLNGNSFADDVLSEVEVAFGHRLGVMDDNDSNGDADDELSDDEEEQEEDENNADEDADDELPDDEEEQDEDENMSLLITLLGSSVVAVHSYAAAGESSVIIHGESSYVFVLILLFRTHYASSQALRRS